MNLLNLDSLPIELRNAVTVQSLAPGQVLYQQGDPANTFYVVETGRLKLVRYGEAERMTTLVIARPGEELAEIALFADVYPCTAIAEVASQVIAYPKQVLLSALRHYPDLAEDFMTMLVQRIQTLQIRLELRDIRASHERVLRYLRYLAQPGEQTIITFDRPLKDIAIDLGLTPETLSRALSRLERDGRISRSQQQIILHNSSAA
jgi:CRP/FNR family transcriptional regulator, dissimilatory nitrate respiration regulator